MHNLDDDHSNPSRLKVTYPFCRRRNQSRVQSNPSLCSGINQYHQSDVLGKQDSRPNMHYQMSDQNQTLRYQLDELRRLNYELRTRLQGKQKELQGAETQFKQTLINYNQRLQSTNKEMAQVLMTESRGLLDLKQKGKERSRSRLLAIKKELRSIDGLSQADSRTKFSNYGNRK